MQLPSNHRDTAAVQTLRLTIVLEQAGCRSDYSTVDHLYTITVLKEKAHEWQRNIWVAAIDFKKAFDCVDHRRLWETLRNQNIPDPYVRLLKSLYANQMATVKTDKRSKEFNIERGVKQGDPLSSLLFNAVLEDLFKTLKNKWALRKLGVQLGYTTSTTLTNLRFADDVLLVAPTQKQLTEMLTDLHNQAKQYGLELHPDEIKILTNTSRRRGRTTQTHITIDALPIEILDYHQKTKYLGRQLGFDDYHADELDHRIAGAWRKFNMLRHELTSNTYPLQSRLKLFDGTITPSILYGCEAWTLTKQLTAKLTCTQRRMLRLVIGTPRRRQPQANDNNEDDDNNNTNNSDRKHNKCKNRNNSNDNDDNQDNHDNTQHPDKANKKNTNKDDNNSDHNSNSDEDSEDDVGSTTTDNIDPALKDLLEEDPLEPWQDFIQRATRTAEEAKDKFGLADWVELYWRRKWRWSKRVASQSKNRWSYIITTWDPAADNQRRTGRKQARPKKRWDDDIQEFLDTTHHHKHNNDTPNDNHHHNTHNGTTHPDTSSDQSGQQRQRQHWYETAEDGQCWNGLEDNSEDPEEPQRHLPWHQVAKDTKWWDALENRFVQHMQNK